MTGKMHRDPGTSARVRLCPKSTCNCCLAQPFMHHWSVSRVHRARRPRRPGCCSLRIIFLDGYCRPSTRSLEKTRCNSSLHDARENCMHCKDYKSTFHRRKELYCYVRVPTPDSNSWKTSRTVTRSVTNHVICFTPHSSVAPCCGAYSPSLLLLLSSIVSSINGRDQVRKNTMSIEPNQDDISRTAGRAPERRARDHPFTRHTADIKFVTADGVEFKVHSVILSEASPLWESMFRLPQPSDAEGETSSDIPSIEVIEDSVTINNLLSMCYPMQRPVLYDLDEVRDTLKAAIKYDVPHVITLLKESALSFLRAAPLRVYDLVLQRLRGHRIASCPSGTVEQLPVGCALSHAV